MPFLTNAPLPQCLQHSSATRRLLARDHDRGCMRHLLKVKCLELNTELGTVCSSPLSPLFQYCLYSPQVDVTVLGLIVIFILVMVAIFYKASRAARAGGG